MSRRVRDKSLKPCLRQANSLRPAEITTHVLAAWTLVIGHHTSYCHSKLVAGKAVARHHTRIWQAANSAAVNRRGVATVTTAECLGGCCQSEVIYQQYHRRHVQAVVSRQRSPGIIITRPRHRPTSHAFNRFSFASRRRPVSTVAEVLAHNVPHRHTK